MSLSVLQAMKNSKTPEEFLDLVLDAVKNNAWLYARKPSQEDVEKWSRDKFKFPGVSFQSDKKADKVLFFSLNTLDAPKTTRRTVVQNIPRIRLSDRLYIPLGPFEWEEAVKALGVKPMRFSQESPSVSNDLLIPYSHVIPHWPSSELTPENSERPHVLVADEKIDALLKWSYASRTVTDYLTTLEFIGGGLNRESYESQLRMQRRGLKFKDPVDRFLEVSSAHRDFFKFLGGIFDTDEPFPSRKLFKSKTRMVEDRIVSQFRLEKCAFTHDLAKKAVDHLASPRVRTWAHQLNERLRV